MRRRARRRSGRTRRLPRFDRRRGPVSYGTRPIPLSSSSRNLPAIWDDGAHARLNDACCHCQSTAAPLEDRGLEPLREASSVAQAITVTDIRKNFGAVEALKGVSLDVAEGEKVVVIGPSGSGKSVLIRCINGLE
ncbi:MAG: ATP-binding cassette domain-containing protein, partial [Eggerthella lenta]